jgi:hypothetical protein
VQQDDRRRLRQPAAGRELLSDLQHRRLQRRVHLAARRPADQGTTNTFGGTSTAEFGPLLQSVYPVAGFVPSFRYNNFRNILSTNPCPA